MDLQNKNVLVTGASGGIGKAIANELTKRGCNVARHYNLNEIKEDRFSIQADITKKDEIRKMFEMIREKYKHLDILINTIGIEEAFDDQLDTDTWQRTFQINLFGIVECVRYSLPLMKDRKGVIVNISSIMGNAGIVGLNSLAYSTSKAALQKFSENLSLMLSPDIRVVSISPGYTETPIWNSFNDEQKNEAIGSVPIRRFIKSEEIAKFVVSVCNNNAITGGNYIIAGGLNLKSII